MFFVSINLFFLQIVRNNFDYFWKSISLFFLFFQVLIVFWCFPPFTARVLFWMIIIKRIIAPAPWWPCSCPKAVYGLRRLEKSWNFYMHTCLWTGAQRLDCSDINEWIVMELLFYFVILAKRVASFIGMSFFHLWVRFLSWIFLVLQCHETFAIGFRNWLDHKWIDF